MTTFIKNSKVYEHYYIHNVFADFFSQTLDFLADSFGVRFNHKVMATYDKAVEYLKNLNQEGRETDKELLPTVVVNPSGEFDLSQIHGKQPFRFPNIAPGWILRIFESIYQDDNVKITPGCSRFVGDLEAIFLVNSIYEYCDVRTMLIHAFNGIGRMTYPFVVNTFITLPDELILYEYNNEYTSVNYPLDWESQGSTRRIIKSIDQQKYIYPATALPSFRLTGMSDGSNKYGSSDSLAEWRIVCTFSYEIEMPTFFFLEADYLAERIRFNIQTGSAYSYYSDITNVPETILRFESFYPQTVDKNEFAMGVDVGDVQITNLEDLELKIRYYHVITESESESTDDLEIIIPEPVPDIELVRVFSQSGELAYGQQFTIVEESEVYTLIIKRSTVTLEENQLIEIFIYRAMKSKL